MRFAIAMLLATIALNSSPARAAEISHDSGGRIGTYVERFTRLRESGERVVVDGQCLSACTLVLALIPRDHICVTQDASFGFHAAWSPGSSGNQVTNPEATRLLWDMYPPRVRNWIRHNGGLGRSLIYLRGHDLAALYPPCSPGSEEGGVAAARGTEAHAGRRREARRLHARTRPVLRSEHESAVASSSYFAPPGWR